MAQTFIFGAFCDFENRSLTGYPRQSRILYHRQIQERVKKIAPFITFDRDAYMVIAQGGRLFWMIDGYTISDRFPYSEPMRRRGTNYIRNSVKAVVDAYNGTVNFI